jgi:hypothetical protein
MKLLFVAGNSYRVDELLGMAQLSAAFDQDVALWHPHGLLDTRQLEASKAAGITKIASAETTLQQWLAGAERVIRL